MDLEGGIKANEEIWVGIGDMMFLTIFLQILGK